MKAKLVNNSFTYDCSVCDNIELYTKKHWWSSWVYRGRSNTVAGALLLLSCESRPLYIIVDKYVLEAMYAK